MKLLVPEFLSLSLEDTVRDTVEMITTDIKVQTGPKKECLPVSCLTSGNGVSDDHCS